MPNIRIKDIPSTASATSSTDFIGIDGSANGTRKLNAFSPTFGGNLTVSGTGGITASAAVAPITALGTSGTSGVFVSDGHLNDLQGNTSQHFLIKRSKNTATQSRWAFQLQGGENTSDSPVAGSELVFAYSTAGTGTFTNALSLTRAGNATLAGNLTVSGTGNSSVAGNLGIGTTSPVSNANQTSLTINGTNYSRIDMQKGGSTYFNIVMDNTATGLSTIGSLPLNLNTNGATRLTVTGGGNVLLGTPTDSSNGKLQLATHTTSAGGIGFGTDTSLYRLAGGQLSVDHTGNNPALKLSISGTAYGWMEYYSPDNAVYLTSGAGKSLVLRTNGATTALTLDSSQRCILAGALRLNNAYTAGAPTATGYVTIQDSAGNTYKVLVGT